MVNRIWQWHLGTGLVSTANDFGVNGNPPSHLELLDWLAIEFIRSGWSVKHMHRLILNSRAYQQASGDVPGAATALSVDPRNRLLWRFSRRRLSAEELRDSMLAVSGRLNPELGGPSIILPVDPDLVGLLYDPKQWQVTPDVTQHDRRSAFLFAKRNLRLPFLELFDQPDLQTSCARREQSTHPPQALELLNGDFANDMAASLAKRLESECGADRDRLLERAFLLTTSRAPMPSERALAAEFLRDGSLCEFALALLNLNAFLYVN
jgi:hypothetical protein